MKCTVETKTTYEEGALRVTLMEPGLELARVDITARAAGGSCRAEAAGCVLTLSEAQALHGILGQILAPKKKAQAAE